MTAGGGGSEMGQSKDETASDLTSVFEATEHSENTTGTEGNMSAAGTLFIHVLFSGKFGNTAYSLDANSLDLVSKS